MSASAENELVLAREENAALRAENHLLRQKIDLLIRKIFGSSSEQIDPAQLELLLQLSAAPVVVKKSRLSGKAKPARVLKVFRVCRRTCR